MCTVEGQPFFFVFSSFMQSWFHIYLYLMTLSNFIVILTAFTSFSTSIFIPLLHILFSLLSLFFSLSFSFSFFPLLSPYRPLHLFLIILFSCSPLLLLLLPFFLLLLLTCCMVSLQDELADVLVTLFDSKNRLAPFLTRIFNTEVKWEYIHSYKYMYTYNYI